MTPQFSNQHDGRQEGESERARKACLACRKQKMKCVPTKHSCGPSCLRCHRMQLPCIHRPRGNAASLQDSQRPSTSSAAQGVQDFSFVQTLLRRVERIEKHLGLSNEDLDATSHSTNSTSPMGPSRSLAPVLTASMHLKIKAAGAPNAEGWNAGIVEHLWRSFHDAMPGLHFLPQKQVFTVPTPLLLASMLYCSASRGPACLAQYAPTYHSSLCHEISCLMMPHDGLGASTTPFEISEEWGFQIVLGIVLAALLSEGQTRHTGLWLSVAYRLLLEHCPPRLTNNTRQWQQLFTGLQIFDLEHASLYLTCPTLPLESPLHSIQMSSTDQLYSLSRMMHVGLAHFAGRGLPTIWSYFVNDGHPDVVFTGHSYSGVDTAVIRDWARQLDDWLARFSLGPFENESDRKAVYRQYVLHRLLVLSIYLPSRQYDIFSPHETPAERHELLLSAKATVKLHTRDSTIWSNWDLIMITWAALIVLQGAQGGHIEPGDIQAIRVHLDLLKQTREPIPSLRHTLADHLEFKLQHVESDHTTAPMPTTRDAGDPFRGPWNLFDEASLESVNRYLWPDDDDLQVLPVAS
ncbi:hypothetical protein KC332_g8030 [Hortaea werneckii]|uniref:Zn(2)-C6 fungal-type domain-containing protein n=1 Tax=Hortaea werneckii EXF-2000 TaxID=1157616 RepID=A0A1Z5SQU7_HORWE|nr:hypothetical protein KC358_g932 [Hortaea werneckii]OTA23180.1 hypothetical protein BTJ68_13235 [Hortaea werneckii EXF-2000]KAI6938539.1 hypothetical protein KC341_g4826 [Hortaea werneckii]KAI6939821.1 hypothetical protein KC348_g5174 [Hortaea werneckii]KAI6966763.1 hypothetical protein KC321_g9381 [Hortaea werneckii]